MRYISVLSFILLLLTNFAGAQESQSAVDNDWLIGTWWYANSTGRVIEDEDKDGMVFDRDGSVALVYGSGNPYLRCEYRTPGDADLLVECRVREQTKTFKFAINRDRTRLSNVDDSDRGFYVRH